MTPLIREWAGSDRVFKLDFGGVMDLEEACAKSGLGAIYLRMGSHQYRAGDIYHTIRLALIGGGMKPIEAQALMRERFDARPMVENHECALEILITLMGGIAPPEDDEGKGDPDEPIPFGEIAANFAKAGVSPASLREMRYDDFIAMLRALRRSGEAEVKPPSEEEYFDMIARMEGRA
jgi:hypothetical protein